MSVAFRPLGEEDLPQLAAWLSSPWVKQHYTSGDTSLEAVRSKYLPRIHGRGATRCYLALNEAQESFAFLQQTLAPHGVAQLLGFAPPEPRIVGIDLFLVAERFAGRGLGGTTLNQFTADVFAGGGADFAVVNPAIGNLSARRAYEKAGWHLLREQGDTAWYGVSRRRFPPQREVRDPFQVQIGIFREHGGCREYLLLLRSPERGGFWQSVTGGVEYRESVIAAARREVGEEVGISIAEEELIDLRFAFWFVVDGVFHPEFVFGLKVPGDARGTISREHTEMKWAPLGEALSLLQWESNREALRRVEGWAGERR